MNHTTQRFSRRMGEQRPCDAQDANAWHPCLRPLVQRMVIGLMAWGWAVLAALALVLAATGHLPPFPHGTWADALRSLATSPSTP